MLSKNNKVLIGCLALLLVMSVGYALFSDTITINGSATAKGDFNIVATCQTGIASKLGTVESLNLYKDIGYQNDTCSVVDDKVSLNTEFLYPGSRRNFTVKMTNNGTIDAVLDMSKASIIKEICVANNIEGENKECETFGSGQTAILNNYHANTQFDLIAIEDPNGNLLSQSDMLEFVEGRTVAVKPGYSIYSYVSLLLNHAPNYVGSGVMFVEYSTTLTAPFEQITN